MAHFRVLIFMLGGGGEIRTHGPITQTPVFKTGAIDHSATPPCLEIGTSFHPTHVEIVGKY